MFALVSWNMMATDDEKWWKKMVGIEKQTALSFEVFSLEKKDFVKNRLSSDFGEK